MRRFFVMGLMVCFVATAVRGAESKPKTPIQIKSLGQLARLLHLHKPQYFQPSNTGVVGPHVGSGTIVGAPTIATNAPAATGTSANNADFSATNVQVRGVDEGDFVKTDGEYIYQISNGKLLVIHAMPATQITLTGSVDLGSEFYPIDLYVRGDRLVVTGSHFSFNPIPVDPLPGISATAASGTPISPAYSGPETQVLIFDTTDKANLKPIRSIGVDGNLVSSRRIDNFVYLVTSVYPEFVTETAGVSNVSAGTLKGRKPPRKKRTQASFVPLLRDTAKNADLQPIALENIFVFPDFSEPVFMTLAAFDIQDPASPVNVKAYLGASENIYVSPSNLYVQSTHFYPRPIVMPDQPQAPVATVGGTPQRPQTRIRSFQIGSTIYKFALNAGAIDYVAQADVPGQVLNSFSMDENGGYFRVATTSNVWQADQSSGVYVLDANLQLAGKIEQLAPGERIFSARFIGERAYLVTFHRVDPLFVIDLSKPTAPAVLGEVVLTGVSDYLQPFDATHLLGFGSNTDASGRMIGFKMALFDVSDPARPTELQSVVIDNASSEVQYDHRALLFDASRHLLALPVTFTSNSNIGSPIPLISTVTTSVPNIVLPILPFIDPSVVSEAQVYDISLEHGFVLRKKVPTTLAYEFMHRIIAIGDYIYAISDGTVTALDFTTLNLQSTLNLPNPLGSGGNLGTPLQVQF